MRTTRKASTLVGLDIGTASIAAVEVSTNGSATITRTGIAPLESGLSDDGEVSDERALGEALKDLFAQNKLDRSVRIGLANQRVVVRTLRMPRIADKKELGTAIRFQAQDEIPMPMEEAVLDWQVMDSDPGAAPGSMEVVVVAARRDMVKRLVAAVRLGGLRPVGLDVAAFGMIRAFSADGFGRNQVPGYEDRMGPSVDGAAVGVAQAARLFCNLGDVTNLAVARGSGCLFTRVFPYGIESIAQSLAERQALTLEHSRMWLSHVGLSEPLERLEGDPEIVASARDVLVEGAAKLAAEMRLSLDYYSTQEAAAAIEEIIVCGPGSTIPGLAEHLQQDLGYALRVGRPSALVGLSAEQASRLTVPFGLALEE